MPEIRSSSGEKPLLTGYGAVAVAAVKLAHGGLDPVGAWPEAALAIFPHSASQRDKDCPKGAFLGLCQEGLVAGVQAGKYTRSIDNKGYAIRAVELLASDPRLAEPGPKVLWDRVIGGVTKSHNGQMDVVLALWRNGLLAAQAKV
jgi:hypothetical protein